jgi:chaperone modulatory protein CbpM
MNVHEEKMFEGQLLDDRTEISIVQLCRIFSVESSMVERLMEEGVIEPIRYENDVSYFPQSCLKRTRVVMSLRNDLGVNLAGAALALELLEQIERLRSKLRLVASENMVDLR